MHIFVSFVYNDTVQIDFHYLHLDVSPIVCGPTTSLIVQAYAMKHVRELLNTVSAVRRVQSKLDTIRRQYAAPGHLRIHKKLVDPVVLHDACTLYAGILGAYFGRPASYTSLGVKCPGCGRDEWGYTVEPPRLTAYGLIREVTDTPVSFCWTCAKTHDEATAKARSKSLTDCVRSSLVSLMFDVWV